jgi:hypothetical protein
MRSGSAKGASFAGAGLEVVESETTVVGGTSDGTAAAKSGARITARYGRESLE